MFDWESNFQEKLSGADDASATFNTGRLFPALFADEKMLPNSSETALPAAPTLNPPGGRPGCLQTCSRFLFV